MSDKKQRQLPKMGEKWEKRGGSDVNKKVHARDVHDLLTSHMSKPVAHGCTLPEIGNGWLMKQHTGNILHTGSGEVASTHLPPLPVQAVAHQQVKELSKRSFASRHGFEELPLLAAVVKPDCSNKEGSHLKQGRRMPVRLIPIENMSQSSSGSSRSAGHRPETFGSPTQLNNLCKLPDIKNTQVKRSRPKSGNMHRLPCALPPISEGKSLKLPPHDNMQRAESPITDKAKKKKKMM